MDARVREVVLEDLDRLFFWRNMEDITRFGSGKKKVGYREHKKWLTDCLSRDDRFQYIIQDGPIDCGLIRFEETPSVEEGRYSTEVKIYILKEHRNKGLGSKCLALAMGDYFEHGLPKFIVANVRGDNEASKRFFVNMGFDLHSTYNDNGINLCTYVYVTEGQRKWIA